MESRGGAVRIEIVHIEPSLFRKILKFGNNLFRRTATGEYPDKSVPADSHYGEFLTRFIPTGSATVRSLFGYFLFGISIDGGTREIFRNGVLKVEIPRRRDREQSPVRRIQINR